MHDDMMVKCHVVVWIQGKPVDNIQEPAEQCSCVCLSKSGVLRSRVWNQELGSVRATPEPVRVYRSHFRGSREGNAKGIMLRGDSIIALTWAMTERPRGVRVTNASIIWTLLCIATDIDMKKVTHIAGEENGRCDRLSRRGSDTTISVLQEAEDMGTRGADVLEIDSNQSVRDIIGLCDPRTDLNSEAEFMSFWLRARGIIEVFVKKYLHTPHT